MKFVRGLCSFFLHYILIIVLIILGLSFSVKNIFIDLVYKEEIQKEFIDSVDSSEYDEILKIFEMEESKKIVANIVDDITSNENSQYDIEKEIVIFLNDNKDKFSELYDIKISDADLVKIEEEIYNSNLNEEYIEIKQDFKSSLDEDKKIILDIYSFAVSIIFRTILICTALILLVLIALLQKSYYKWIRSLGIVGIISGVLGIIIGFLMDFIIREMLKINVLEMGIFSKMSIGVVLGGIVCIICYIFINKKFNNGGI